jgi:hypothetical protein
VNEDSQYPDDVVEAQVLGQVGVGWRLLAGAQVDVVGVGAEDEVRDKLSQPAEHIDPDVNIVTPELILDCCRIFDQENESVSCDDDAIEEKHRLSCQDKFEKVVETAN